MKFFTVKKVGTCRVTGAGAEIKGWVFDLRGEGRQPEPYIDVSRKGNKKAVVEIRTC